jgi:hypothetical protein
MKTMKTTPAQKRIAYLLTEQHQVTNDYAARPLIRDAMLAELDRQIAELTFRK